MITIDLVVPKECMGYVYQNLHDFLKNINKMMCEGGFFSESQSFLAEEDWGFKDVNECPEKLQEIFWAFVKPGHYFVEWVWNYDGRPLVHLPGKF